MCTLMGDTRLLGAENIVRDEPETEERSCKGTLRLLIFSQMTHSRYVSNKVIIRGIASISFIDP